MVDVLPPVTSGGATVLPPVGQYMSPAAVEAAITAQAAVDSSTYVPRSATAPDHAIAPAYINTSTVPPVLMGWNGSAFIPIGTTKLDDGLGVVSICA